MFGKPRILSLIINSLIHSIKHERSCKILYVYVFDYLCSKVPLHPMDWSVIVTVSSHTLLTIFKGNCVAPITQ